MGVNAAATAPDWFINLMIYLFGLGLFILEIFIPSGGLIGIGAFGCVGFALYSIFAAGYTEVGLALVVLTLVYMVATFYWGLNRITSRASLDDAVATGDDVTAALELLGVAGEAITPLRPAGIARIDGRRFDVVGTGGFIPDGARVRVVEVNGNRIVVREEVTTAPTDSTEEPA